MGRMKLRPLDAGLAQLYDVPTKALNQAIKRNVGRFPSGSMFQLDEAAKAEVVTSCDHPQKLKFSRSLPFAFTEFGAVALANILASSRAGRDGHLRGACVHTAAASSEPE